MKRLLALTLGATLVCGSAAFAADTPETKKGPREFPGMDHRMEMMTKQLNLTSEQQTKVKAVFEEEFKGMRDARGSFAQLTPEERRQKMTDRREAFEAKMKKILTGDQWTKWEKQRRVPQGGPGIEKKGERKGEVKGSEGEPAAKKHKKKAE
jgi:Spy/CpxP family protein refolding chaperone